MRTPPAFATNPHRRPANGPENGRRRLYSVLTNTLLSPIRETDSEILQRCLRLRRLALESLARPLSMYRTGRSLPSLSLVDDSGTRGSFCLLHSPFLRRGKRCSRKNNRGLCSRLPAEGEARLRSIRHRCGDAPLPEWPECTPGGFAPPS